MAALLPSPELQFCDADGMPYAGGTLATLVAGTSTPKPTWVDPMQAALNTNPIVLDAAGRCLCWGDGDYRLILHDAAGNLIWDQPSSTIVSAAMMPVVTAPTIPDAVEILGINDLIAAEADIRSAADSAETSARIAADATLTTNLNAEIARAEAAEANLQSQIDALNAVVRPTIQHGYNGTSGDGHIRITFATAFTTTPDVTVQFAASGWAVVSTTVTADTTGFDVWLALPAPGVTHAPGDFYWIAVGS
jgi:hypothetical protein